MEEIIVVDDAVVVFVVVVEREYNYLTTNLVYIIETFCFHFYYRSQFFDKKCGSPVKEENSFLSGRFFSWA